MTRPRLLRISATSLIRHNRATQVTIVLVALLLALPVVLELTIGNYLAASEEKRREIFGDFSDIYYDDSPQTAQSLDDLSILEEKLPGFSYAQRGQATIVGALPFAEDEDPQRATPHYVAVADADWVQLARMKIEGRMPLKRGEILLSRDRLEALGKAQAKPGGRLKLWDREWTISGIAEPFGALWTRDQKQTEDRIAPPSGFVSREDGAEMLAAAAAQPRFRIFLFERGDLDNRAMSFNPEQRFFYNHSRDHSDEGANVSMPSWYFVGLRLALFLTALLSFLFYRRRRDDIYRRLARLGMDRRGQRGMVFSDALLLSLALALSSALLSLLLSYLSYRVITRLGSFSYAFAPPPQLWLRSWLLSLGVALGALAIHVVISLYRIQRAGRTGRRRRRRGHRGGLLRLEWRQQRVGIILLIVAFGVSALVIDQNRVISARYHARTPRWAVKGRVSEVWDYEVALDGKKYQQAIVVDSGVSISTANPGDVFYSDPQSLGVDEAFVEACRAIEGVRQVDAYRSFPQFQVERSGRFDDYIDGRDGRLDGQREILETLGIYEPEQREAMGIAGDWDLAGMRSYPDHYLESLAPLIREGQIDLAKLDSGEEVILYAPAYKLHSLEEEGPDGSTSLSYSIELSSSDDPDALQLTSYRVGDEIKVGTLVATAPIYGNMTFETAQKHLEWRERTVRIGAILREPAGHFQSEFPVYNAVVTCYTTHAGSAHFLALPRYDRVQITADAHADHVRIRAEIDRAMADYPAVSVTDMHAKLSNFRSYGLFMDFFVYLLQGMMVMMSLALLLTLLMNQFHGQLGRYRLLRQLGSPARRIVGNWVALYTWALALAFALYAGMSYLYYFFRERPVEMEMHPGLQRGFSVAAQTWVILAAVLLLVMLAMRRQLRRPEALQAR